MEKVPKIKSKSNVRIEETILSNFEKLKLNFPILLFNALGAFGDTVGFPVGLGCPLIPTLDVLF